MIDDEDFFRTPQAHIEAKPVPAANCEIRFEGFTNTAQQRAVERTLEQIRPLFPSWMQTLIVRCERAEAQSEIARMTVNPSYLFCVLRVRPAWFEEPECAQRAHLIHEIIHAQDGPVWVFVDNHIIPAIRKHNEELANTLQDLFEERIEAATQERMRILDAILPRPEPNDGE